MGFIKNIFILKRKNNVNTTTKVSRSIENIKLKNNQKIKPVFESIKIGNQIWMVKNLDVSTFLNGDPIPETKSDKAWKKAGKKGIPAWCYYNNDVQNGPKYGKLYNWYAINDPRGLAPEEWHIPSNKEFEVLINNYGGEGSQSYYELLPSGSSGFNSLFGGWRNSDGKFYNIGKYAQYWSATERDDHSSQAWLLGILSLFKAAQMGIIEKSIGYSIRCLHG